MPRLLRADDAGRLVIAGPLNPGAALTAAVNPGGSLFVVTDGSVFPVGTYFVVVPGPNRGGGPDGRVFQVKTRAGQQLTTFQGSPLNITYQPGDFLVALTRQYFPQDDPSRAGVTHAFHSPASNVIAKVQIGGAVGQTIRLIKATFDLTSAAGVAFNTNVNIADNLGGSYYQRQLSVGALEVEHDRIQEDELWLDIPGAAGQTVTITFFSVAVNIFESVNVDYKILQT